MPDEKEFRYIISDEGVIRDQDGNVYGNNTGSPEENRRFEQAKAEGERATDQDVDAYYEAENFDPDFPVVKTQMQELEAIRLANGGEPMDWTNHALFMAEYNEVKNALVKSALDAPRLRATEQLKTALAEERARNDGRESARSQAILEKLSSLYGGNR